MFDIVERIIDCYQDSKEDLLRLSLVRSDWLDHSRYYLLLNFMRNLSLDSMEKIRAFSEITSSPLCTFTGRQFDSISINIQTPQLAFSLQEQEELTELFHSLKGIVVLDRLAINLDAITTVNCCSPFPWGSFQGLSWTALTDVSIVATLPDLRTLSLLMLGLPYLTSLHIDASYIDKTIPTTPTSEGSLPSGLNSLRLGPRGIELLSWLALEPNYISSLTLNLGSNDLSPLKAYALSNGANLKNLDVTVYDGKILKELAACTLAMKNLITVSIQLRFLSSCGYVDAVTAIASGVASRCLKIFYVYAPVLADDVDDDPEPEEGESLELVQALGQHKGAVCGVCMCRWLGRRVEQDEAMRLGVPAV